MCRVARCVSREPARSELTTGGGYAVLQQRKCHEPGWSVVMSIRGNCHCLIAVPVCPDREFYPGEVGSTLFGPGMPLRATR